MKRYFVNNEGSYALLNICVRMFKLSLQNEEE